jgi:hypothetical protein
MNPAHRTWLVECFLPGVDDDDVSAAADRARAAVRTLRGTGRRIDYLGAVLMAADEVVFHAFAADEPEIVRAASSAASLGFERVVESMTWPPDLSGEAAPA